MRVFVTGAGGYIGSALVEVLVRAGHKVTGLVRSREREAQVKALGAEPLLGDLSEPTRWIRAAANHDALIHLGIDYRGDTAAVDRAALDALLSAGRVDAQERILVYTSGIWVLGDTGGRTLDETAPTDKAAAAVAWRPPHERLVLESGTHRLATAVIRPGMVYGGRVGLISPFFASALQQGAAIYVGDGQNRWPPVHRKDLAELYRTVIEKRAKGVFHGVDGSSPKVVEMARACSQAAGKNGATRSMPVEEARKTMGPMADALCLDQVIRGRRSADLGWKPAHPPFLESVGAAWEEFRA